MTWQDQERVLATASAASGVDYVGAALIMDLTQVTPNALSNGEWSFDLLPFAYATAANSDHSAVYGIALDTGPNQGDRFPVGIRGNFTAAVYNGSSTAIAVGDPLSLGRTGTAAALLYKAQTGENIVAYAMEATAGTASSVNIVNAPRLRIYKPNVGSLGVMQ